ncbi:Ni/Fe hydrogenase subunit alpha [Candidatus Acetothermia bacterium]|jgi:coenzyme F420-reducing hydrogenase alpha subunit|nr:Ni/Fe hydrogenase subunit alpha [Candidatus Acetothermia bacterium]MCI2432459.1 Ni/Fe hydrogenase subunit alpha [Candidatus Acetothermia bacterium]MCI2437097.1 Ni/Fe hydrogenase subunit alpha [Candidatus Acetothermia bacterium]
MSKSSKTIKVDYLARVEGEGALYIKIKNNKITNLKFKIFEPPRFFEAFLRGRSFTEAPDITARICGICPIAYQMSSCHAMEDACGVKVEGQLRALRRLIYCGEWIESHVLHVAMLHAPDFLGYESAIHMAKDHPDLVQKALKLKKTGNEIVTLLGGREIHPINVRVGGFYRVPTKSELQELVPNLQWARDAAYELVRWTGTLDFPDLEQDYEFVALRHPDEYPFNEGRLVSSKGLEIAIREYEEHFVEEHVEHSNALHSVLRRDLPPSPLSKGKGDPHPAPSPLKGEGRGEGKKRSGEMSGNYFVGPSARYSLNFDRLPSSVQQAAKEAGLGPVCTNPFKSIIVRSVETLYACEEALRIIGEYEMPEKPFVEVPPRAATGSGCTEAPRGILYHRYRIDDHGAILDAKIVPPTSQNQKTIESDLWQFVPKNISLPKEKLTWQCEQAIRNYDPCISCATHFLKLHIERE